MRLILVTGLVLLTNGLPLASGQDAKDSATSPLGTKLARIQKQFEDDEKGLKKKLADAKDAEEKRQANFQIKELHAITASDAIEIAEEGKRTRPAWTRPCSPSSCSASFRSPGSDMDKACDIILRHHVESPKIAPALASMVEVGPTGSPSSKPWPKRRPRTT